MKSTVLFWSGRVGCFNNWTEKEPSTLTVLHHVQVEQKISQAIRQRQRRKEGQTCVGLCHRFAWRQWPIVQFACKFYHNFYLRRIPDVNTGNWMFVERCFDLLLKWFVFLWFQCELWSISVSNKVSQFLHAWFSLKKNVLEKANICCSQTKQNTLCELLGSTFMR